MLLEHETEAFIQREAKRRESIAGYAPAVDIEAVRKDADADIARIIALIHEHATTAHAPDPVYHAEPTAVGRHLKVICPFTKVYPQARAALLAQAPNAHFVDVSDSPDAYYDLFRRLWALREDFVLVEHDVVLAPGTIAAFDKCPEPWCGVKMAGVKHPEAYFQCNRWRAEVMEAYPTVPNIPMSQRGWWTLDSYLLAKIRESGVYERHLHNGLESRHNAPHLGSRIDWPVVERWKERYGAPGQPVAPPKSRPRNARTTVPVLTPAPPPVQATQPATQRPLLRPPTTPTARNGILRPR